MRASLIGGPFEGTRREVEASPPDVVLCSDRDDPIREHVYRLRGIEGTGDEERAVYVHEPGP